MAEAIRILSVNQDYSSEFHGENLKKVLLENDELRNYKIVPIAITGAMRTGKSFILNYFLRYLRAQYVSHDISNWIGNPEEPLTGFESYASSERVTSGIMMWPELFLYDSPEHGKLAIVLMDTQGLFDNQTSLAHNSTIFTLTAMMSSVQIYNVMNNLNENDLQLMQLFSEYGKAALENSDSKPFQKLIVLVRDWNPQNGLDFGFKGGSCLIEKRMRSDPRLKSVRDDINGSFESLGCFLMHHPGDRLYEKNFDGSVGCLHNDFIATLENFVESVLKSENLAPKRMNGVTVDLVDYVNNFQFYAEYFSQNQLPACENFTTAMVHNNTLNAMKAAVEEYQSKMLNLPRYFESTDELDCIHQQVREEMLSRFDARTKFGKTHAKTYRNELDQLIGNIYEKIQSETFKELAENVDAVKVREGFMSYFKKYFKVVICAIEELFSYVARILRPALTEFAKHFEEVPVEIAKVIASILIKKIHQRMTGNGA